MLERHKLDYIISLFVCLFHDSHLFQAMSCKKVLLTGASGLLGRALYKEFENDASWEILGLAYSRAKGKLRKVDITDSAAVNQVVEEFGVRAEPSLYPHGT